MEIKRVHLFISVTSLFNLLHSSSSSRIFVYVWKAAQSPGKRCCSCKFHLTAYFHWSKQQPSLSSPTTFKLQLPLTLQGKTNRSRGSAGSPARLLSGTCAKDNKEGSQSSDSASTAQSPPLAGILALFMLSGFNNSTLHLDKSTKL